MNLRLVIDTNVLVSSVLTPGGNPDEVLQGVFDGGLHLILSRAILEEARRVFSYPKIRKLQEQESVSVEEIEGFLISLGRISTLVAPMEQSSFIHEDPADNMILAAAVAGRADFIVSGDRHLLDLKEHRGITILTPAGLMKRLGDHFPAA